MQTKTNTSTNEAVITTSKRLDQIYLSLIAFDWMFDGVHGGHNIFRCYRGLPERYICIDPDFQQRKWIVSILGYGETKVSFYQPNQPMAIHRLVLSAARKCRMLKAGEYSLPDEYDFGDDWDNKRKCDFIDLVGEWITKN